MDFFPIFSTLNTFVEEPCLKNTRMMTEVYLMKLHLLQYDLDYVFSSMKIKKDNPPSWLILDWCWWVKS